MPNDASLGQLFCDFYDSLSNDTGSDATEESQISKETLHANDQSLPYIPLDSQFQAILNFDDQKQEASAFLGREGGLEEFLSIAFTNEVTFFTDEAKTAKALDILSGGLTEEELKEWPSWRLRELEDFLSFRIRALERSRRLTQTGSFDPSLLRKNKTLSDPTAKEANKENPLAKFLGGRSSKQTTAQKQPFSAIPDIFETQPRKPSWKLIEEHGITTPTLVAVKEGYRFEAGGDYSSVLPDASTLLVVQDADLDINYYEEYFARRIHSNFVANDENKGPIILSMVQSGNHVKILLRTFDEDVRLKTTGPVKIPIMLKNIRFWYPSLAKTKFFQVKDLSIEKALLKIEHNHVTTNYKFGVLYCKDGQTDENLMFGNEHGSDDFNEFLAFLGKEVVLKGWEKFKGGLDSKNDTTGTHSVYTEEYCYEIMFHVSTMLPYIASDEQQLERKRHLGNDVVVIIFKEGDHLFSPDCLRSEFNHVFVVVQKHGVDDEGNTLYKVELACKDCVTQPWRPLLTSPSIYKKDEQFHKWFILKLINAERAGMSATSFINKFNRTRKIIFSDLVQMHMPNKQKL